MRTLVPVLLFVAPLALSAQAMPANHPPLAVRGATEPAWTPHRVYDTRAKRFIDTEAMAAELATADVVLIGEQHDDPGTHAMQRALLESIGRRRPRVVLAMEMFERDAQPLLDGYLATVDPALLPTSAAAVHRLLTLHELEKLAYEVAYERAHRPDWEAIPLGGLQALVERVGS